MCLWFTEEVVAIEDDKSMKAKKGRIAIIGANGKIHELKRDFEHANLLKLLSLDLFADSFTNEKLKFKVWEG